MWLQIQIQVGGLNKMFLFNLQQMPHFPILVVCRSFINIGYG